MKDCEKATNQRHLVQTLWPGQVVNLGLISPAADRWPNFGLSINGACHELGTQNAAP